MYYYSATSALYRLPRIQLTTLSTTIMNGQDCDLGLLEFFHRYIDNARLLFDLCVRHKLILHEKNCEVCDKLATLYFHQKLWRCQKMHSRPKMKKVKCTWSQGVFKNIFFENVSLDLETVLVFVNCYLRECFSYVFIKSEDSGFMAFLPLQWRIKTISTGKNVCLKWPVRFIIPLFICIVCITYLISYCVNNKLAR